jgi:cation diffusion facilitator family transporter
VAAAPMSEAERRRERAMSLGVGTDVLLCTPILGIAIWSGSLTLLADAMRACLLTLLELFAYVVMRRIHRGRLPSYQYGAGKIESFLNLLIGIALVLSSIWIFALGVLSLLQPPQPSQLGLAVAAAIGAVNTTQNAWMFVTFLGARRLGASILIDGQVRTRLLKVVSSASATLAILVSAIFAGQISGRLADLVGSAIVVQMMLWTAYQLIAGALPDLMDRMLDPSQLALVNLVLLCNFDRIDAIHHVRTRRIGEIDAINQSLKKELEAHLPDANVTLVASAVRL